jgi:hypothetical protein
MYQFQFILNWSRRFLYFTFTTKLRAHVIPKFKTLNFEVKSLHFNQSLTRSMLIKDTIYTANPTKADKKKPEDENDTSKKKLTKSKKSTNHQN